MFQSAALLRAFSRPAHRLAANRIRIRKGLLFAAMCVPLAIVSMRVVQARSATAADRGETTRRLEGVLASAKAQLGITQSVVMSLVAENRHVVSVTPPDGATDAFVVSIAEPFLDLLTEDELEAAIAHELGHVWVFTHHPYLQTELRANQVAMRLVSRDSLRRVYEKLWRRDGGKGDLKTFLGEP